MGLGWFYAVPGMGLPWVRDSGGLRNIVINLQTVSHRETV